MMLLEMDWLELMMYLESAIERIEEIENRGTGLSGLPTYFSDLDYYLSGLQEGNLVVLASRPSMGKSSLGLNIATNACKRRQGRCIFLS